MGTLRSRAEEGVGVIKSGKDQKRAVTDAKAVKFQGSTVYTRSSPGKESQEGRNAPNL